jgi:K+-transporting ATPase ATPase C chain
MNINIIKPLKTAVILLLFFTVLTGLIYPLLVAGWAQLFVPWKANGSLLKPQDKIIGSLLIGQVFTKNKYFWGRPSATQVFPYNAAYSLGSNRGPSNPLFIQEVKQRVLDLQQANPASHGQIPVDLVTASGSGLDPEISPLAAFYQIPRVAKARGIAEQEVLILVKNQIKQRSFGILGEPRINVLELNLLLDNRIDLKKE